MYLAVELGFISLPFSGASPTVTVPSQVPVPNLIGKSYQDAQALAVNAGFQLKVDNSLTSGTVIKQSPMPPDKALQGSTINVELQTALPTRVVPDGLMGDTLAAAEAALDQAGIPYSVHPATPPTDPTKGPNIVVEVRPTSGTPLDSTNTVVKLFVVNLTNGTPTRG